PGGAAAEHRVEESGERSLPEDAVEEEREGPGRRDRGERPDDEQRDRARGEALVLPQVREDDEQVLPVFALHGRLPPASGVPLWPHRARRIRGPVRHAPQARSSSAPNASSHAPVALASAAAPSAAPAPITAAGLTLRFTRTSTEPGACALVRRR